MPVLKLSLRPTELEMKAQAFFLKKYLFSLWGMCVPCHEVNHSDWTQVIRPLSTELTHQLPVI